MTKIQLFSKKEQLEVLDMFKGVLVYSKNNKNVLNSETLLIDLLIESIEKIQMIIKDKGV